MAWSIKYDPGLPLPSRIAPNAGSLVFTGRTPTVTNPGGGGGSAPAWFLALADKEFGNPLSNWLGTSGIADPLAASTNMRDSGQHAIIDGYSGIMVDAITGDIATLGNGGHNDYAGNEVMHVNLKTQTAWVRRRNATACSGSGDNRNWSDGRPTASHTYDSLVGANGRWFAVGRAAQNYTGGSGGIHGLWEFTHGTAGLSNSNDWIDYGDVLSMGTGTGALWGGYDAGNDRLISVRGGNATPSIELFRLSDMVSIASNNDTIDDSNVYCGAFDSTNGIVLIHNSSSYYWFRLSTISSGGTWHSITPSSDTKNDQHGFFWHAPSNAFVTYVNGTGLRKCTPSLSGGNYTALSGWTTVSGASGATPGSVSANGLHGRVKLVNDMGDGRSALVYLPGWNNPDLFVMPLPAAGI